MAGFAIYEMNRALGAFTADAASSNDAYCHFGENTLTPHRHASSRRLRRGDVVALNVFPMIWGYYMELERTFEQLLKKAEADRGSLARFDSPFAEITDEDIDALFSE